MGKIAVVCNYLSDYMETIREMKVSKQNRKYFVPVCLEQDICGIDFIAIIQTYKAHHNPAYNEIMKTLEFRINSKSN